MVSYTYDNNSNKLSETWDSGSNMAAWSFTTEDSGASTFTDGYDAEDRFRRFKRASQSEDIYLDRSDIGNISDFKTNGSSSLRSYSTTHELTTVAGVTQQFDVDGNLTANQHGDTLEWDEAGSLAKFTVPTSTTPPAATDVGTTGAGATLEDNTAGIAYVMYSVADVHTRFPLVPSNQADHLTGVRHDGTHWQYGHNGGWVNFTPVSTDRLLATIDFGTSNGSMDRVTPIGTLGVHAEGIDQGFTGGNLTFVANHWAGWPNGGEVSFSGSTFSTSPSALEIVKKGVTEFGYDASNQRVWKKNTVTPDTITVSPTGAGLALEDNTAGTAYVMYSATDVHTRFPTVVSTQADYLVGVRHNGTSWQFGYNNGWTDFTPIASDRLLATIDFGTSNGSMSSITAITTLGVHAQGIKQGFTEGNLTFIANKWAGWANGGEVGFTGTWFRPTEVSHAVYIYAGPNCIAEYDAGTAASSPEQEYIYADQVDSLVMLARGSQKLTVTRNQQWSVTALVDSSDGTVVERYAYDIFGKRTILAEDGSTIRSNSSYDNLYGYTSRRHDQETGLCYFRARYYDPATGEFASRDPLEYVDGSSLYRGYFGIGGVDPLGLSDIFTPCQLGRALAWHWFLGNNEEFTKGANGLKADKAIRNRAKNELNLVFFDLCHMENPGTETGRKVIIVNGGTIQPEDICLRHTTNWPSLDFRLRISYKVTKRECCCTGEFDVEYIWRDVADIHPLIHWPDSWMHYWERFGLADGEYDINISWKEKAFSRIPIGGNNDCDFKSTGWPFEAYEPPAVDPPKREPTICFVAGTHVQLENQVKAIERIQEGDYVWSYAILEKCWKLNRVEALKASWFDGELYSIEFDNEVIESTGTHPYWIVPGKSKEPRPQPVNREAAVENRLQNGQWVEANNLHVGDRVLLRNGCTKQIIGIASRKVKTTVYNLRIQENHNYTVGDDGVLVHNK